jgi:hypothetical protein
LILNCFDEGVIQNNERNSMAENKTKATAGSVNAFLNKLTDTDLKNDCTAIIKIMESVSKEKPVMWGSSIIGFGNYHYVYESGREGDIMIIGFSPRKQNIALYLKGGLDLFTDELASLGKHKTGKGCIYINSLKDVNTAVLKKIIAKSYKSVKSK